MVSGWGTTEQMADDIGQNGASPDVLRYGLVRRVGPAACEAALLKAKGEARPWSFIDDQTALW